MKHESSASATKTSIVKKNIILSLLIKGPAIIVSLLTVPMYINYFVSSSILGVWYSILNIMSWFLTFDLGIGNGLRNKLTEAISLNDTKQQNELISSAYYSTAFVSVTLAVVTYVAVGHVDWNCFFNISPTLISANDLVLSLRIVIIGLVVQMIFKLITSILYALQESATVNLLTLVTNSVLLIYMWISNRYHLTEGIVAISWAHTIATNLPFFVVTIIVFSKRLSTATPKRKNFRFAYASNIVVTGLTILWLQIAIMVVIGTQSITITRLLSPDEVTEFNIYYRIFSGISTMFMLILVPIWSGVTKAQAERDFVWIKATKYKLELLVVATGIVSALVVVALQTVFDIWLQENTITVDYYKAALMALFATVFVWHNVNTSIANGLSRFKTQSICMLIAALLYYPLSILLSNLLNNWSAIVLSSILCLLPYEVIQPMHLNKYIAEETKLRKSGIDNED